MRNLLLLVTGLLLTTSGALAQAQSKHKLFYEQPAKNWLEALPLGNGRLGAMVYGGVKQEQIQFNEETLWTGEPHDYSHKDAGKYLDKIRQLLFEGKQTEAQDLASEVFMSEPLHQKAYQPFGDLIINFPDHQDFSNYRRELDIEQALCKVSYQANGVTYNREVFVSHPNQLMAVKLTSDKSGALNFDLAMDSQHFMKSVSTDGDKQVLDVRVADGVLKGKAWFKVITDGEVTPEYKRILVKDASSATIYLTARTNFVNFRDVSDRPQRYLNGSLREFATLNYDEVRKKHIEDYQSLFNRFQIHFNGNERTSVPTDQRIYQFWKDPNDPQFVSLYVQYARYLMISSSREGGQPANLQGIWNNRLSPPWESKWTTNINAEMNYWPVEVTNLSECHEPLFNLIEECSQSGAIVAKEHYNANGWVLHHNTDIWRGAAPINASNHGIWVTGGAWLSSHLWEHYQFTQDKEFLKEKYPLLKGAATFFTDFLVKDPKSGYLISTPSNSPEIGGLVAGPTMDHQLIRNLFRICIEASEILDTDKAFAEKLKAMIPQIAPNQIGRLGQLQEWLEDKDDPEEKHRHVSHLWAVHPGNEINWKDTPDLMKAARQSLIFRGDEGTGWSLGWKINFWARFLDGNHTYKLIHMLLSPAEEPQRKLRGGSYPNLFDAHPPFQIDGNFGGAAGIVEMLVQSHLGTIDILPALPDALPDGNIAGVCARGGFELSFDWKNGELQNIEIKSKAGKKCKLRYKNRSVDFNTEQGKTYKFNGKLKKIR
ncbi:glycoside hydrolase family 95 protein [Fulvivirgaceae bacterium BMA10]|uniref:Glycoside hydrolase family 95 protein n=1 Tax=Splendidivirga corallicola TaxID=3051826 RepID=A0ABT8KY95_9BACT|nr:glycoside hydrolase family 95 protein [Fulvivirgaceae bacterium BMA10]